MGRWSQYDEDDHRLPNGMTRVGYDADEQVYTYQDENGGLWKGAPGNRYGTLRPVGGQVQRRNTTPYMPTATQNSASLAESPQASRRRAQTESQTTRPPVKDPIMAYGTPYDPHEESSIVSKWIMPVVGSLRRSLTQKFRPAPSQPVDDEEPKPSVGQSLKRRATIGHQRAMQLLRKESTSTEKHALIEEKGEETEQQPASEEEKEQARKRGRVRRRATLSS